MVPCGRVSARAHAGPGVTAWPPPPNQGELRAALTWYNTPYPEYYGFKPEYVGGAGMNECVALTGDVLDGQIRWKGTPDLKPLIGKRVELRIAMKRATLYCVEVSC